MSDITELIKEKVRCCACCGSLKDSEHINGITLNKLATWKHPTWSNLLVQDIHPEPRASAIICDKCMEEGKPPKFAIEWTESLKEVTYHPVSALKDLPPITEEEVREGEKRFFTRRRGDIYC